MALQATLHWTVDGLVSARAQKVVVAELRPERAVILRLRMAARIVLVTGRRCVTREAVQVRLAGVGEIAYLADQLFIVFRIYDWGRDDCVGGGKCHLRCWPLISLADLTC